MAASTNLRLFLDSNVIISGLFSPQGPPGKILQMHANRQLSIVVCQLIIEEIVQTVREKKPPALASLQAFLINAPPEIVKNPAEKEINLWTSLLHFEDALIFAAAISAGPDYFITGDRHFYTDKNLSTKSGLQIITPPNLVKSISG